MSTEESFISSAKSLRELMLSARRAVRRQDERQSTLVHTLDASKQKFAQFWREKCIEEGRPVSPSAQAAQARTEDESSEEELIYTHKHAHRLAQTHTHAEEDEEEEEETEREEEDERESQSSQVASSSLSVSLSLSLSKRSSVDMSNAHAHSTDRKPAHLRQQQQQLSLSIASNGQAQVSEMALLPLYDIEIYLHFDKKGRRGNKRLYPYLTRLHNQRNDKEFLRIHPIVQCAGYANNSLWSKRSVQLELALRPFLQIAPHRVVANLREKPMRRRRGREAEKEAEKEQIGAGDTGFLSHAQAQRFIRENLFLYNILPAESDLSIVDTLWSDEDSNPQRDKISRLTSSDGTAQSQQRTLAKESFAQIEFDIFLLNMVNDYTSLYKQIHSTEGLERFITENNILHDNANLIKNLKKKNEVVSMFEDIIAAQVEAEQHEDAQLKDSSDSTDGSYKCEGMLIAITATNDVHVRPLCTSADMSLAINELQDQRVFREGFISMPHMMQMNLQRYLDGFYRFEYHAKEGLTIKFMKVALPSANRDLKPFIGLVGYTLTSECYTEEVLFSTVKKINTTATSPTATKGATGSPKRNKATNSPQRAQVRFGARNAQSLSGGKKNDRLADERRLPPGLLRYCEHLIRLFNDIYRRFTKVVFSITVDIEVLLVLRDYQRSNITRPLHTYGRGVDTNSFQYRLLSLTNIELTTCLTHFRRKAISGLEGLQQHFLRKFYVAYRKEWATILRRGHDVDTITDFHSLPLAEQSAMRLAFDTYKRLLSDSHSRSSDNEEEVFLSLDENFAVEDEFLVEDKPQDAVSPREKTHTESVVLIDKYRPVEKKAESETEAEESGNSSCAESTAETPLSSVPPELSHRKPSKLSSSPSPSIGEREIERRSSATSATTPRSGTRKPPMMRTKRISFVASDLTEDREKEKEGEEKDRFPSERAAAAQKHVDDLYTQLKSKEKALLAVYSPNSSPVTVPQDKEKEEKGETLFSPLWNPYQGSLRVLCDDNNALSYQQSLSASRELLLREPVIDSPSRSLIAQRDREREMKRIELLEEPCPEEEEDLRLRAFPYLAKVNRAAYRLAEKLDVLSLILGNITDRVGEEEQENGARKEQEKSVGALTSSSMDDRSNVTEKANSLKRSFSSLRSTDAALSTPSLRILQSHSNSFSPKAKNAPSSPALIASEARTPTESGRATERSISMDTFSHMNEKQAKEDIATSALSLQEESVATRDRDGPSSSVSIRSHLRRFSQRFKGLDLVMSSSDESDTEDNTEGEKEQRFAGLTSEQIAEEEKRTLEMILRNIHPKLSQRIRKGLALCEAKLRAIERRKQKRRQQEMVTETDLLHLGHFYALLPRSKSARSYSSSESESEIEESTFKKEETTTSIDSKDARENGMRTQIITNEATVPRRSSSIPVEVRETRASILRRSTERRQNSVAMGNAHIDKDAVTAERDSKTPQKLSREGARDTIFEQITDTLSSMCEEVDQQSLALLQMQAAATSRKSTATPRGKLWGDSDLFANLEFEGSSHVSRTRTPSRPTTARLTSRPFTPAVSLQIAQFATDFCCGTIAVAMKSATDRIVSIRSEGFDLTFVDKLADKMKHPPQRARFNLLDEFNKIFDEPLHPLGDLRHEKQEELEETIDHEFQGEDLTSLLQAMGTGRSSSAAAPSDPLLMSPRPTRPTTSTAMNESTQRKHRKEDAFTKFLKTRKPMGSADLRKAYDQQIREQFTKHKHNDAAAYQPNDIINDVVENKDDPPKYGRKLIVRGTTIENPRDAVLITAERDEEEVPESEDEHAPVDNTAGPFRSDEIVSFPLFPLLLAVSPSNKQRDNSPPRGYLHLSPNSRTRTFHSMPIPELSPHAHALLDRAGEFDDSLSESPSGLPLSSNNVPEAQECILGSVLEGASMLLSNNPRAIPIKSDNNKNPCSVMPSGSACSLDSSSTLHAEVNAQSSRLVRESSPLARAYPGFTDILLSGEEDRFVVAGRKPPLRENARAISPAAKSETPRRPTLGTKPSLLSPNQRKRALK